MRLNAVPPRSMSSANKAVNHGYVQLATVRADGRPANRTIVYRGMAADATLRFCTDIRSSKIQDLLASNAGEACWYFPTTREQVRTTVPPYPASLRDLCSMSSQRRAYTSGSLLSRCLMHPTLVQTLMRLSTRPWRRPVSKHTRGKGGSGVPALIRTLTLHASLWLRSTD